MLTLKALQKIESTEIDLSTVDIHSVATLMQEVLWCCEERIMPKKVWRQINYTTCSLNELMPYLSKNAICLLLKIIDFLTQVMCYKNDNDMSAYRLGEAMGKVTLGPTDCGPILAEKAGHFLTCLIIEHASQKPTCLFKSETTLAKAKFYNRSIYKVQRRNQDWLVYTQEALYALMENTYVQEPFSEEPYLSIFSSQLDPCYALVSPMMFRLVDRAIHPEPEEYLEPIFSNDTIDRHVQTAFDTFVPLLDKPVPCIQEHRSSFGKTMKTYIEKRIPLSIGHKTTKKHDQVKNIVKKVFKIVPIKKS
ncbi:uncharacterized protein B0P05DRAFT_586384 [Gilbertella persicaria]|uniref:uncharacterized protein n=1 Tax=Gilbertella persicaria TaxID=101096 RepID=UPI00221F1A02|nr:uncharacterized protein B0P05DRAFT_586384 [Gilbertella persicaria]KAI8081841.1 hypothetical protein B0P05DRAFT_586384 [Gilbertella persicaria]